MTYRVRLFIVASFLSILVLPVPALSSDKDVRIVNPPSNPVPVASQGTTSVTGSVSATITGTPTVNIGAMPDVNAQISATQSDPVPIRTIVKDPFQEGRNTSVWTDSPSRNISFFNFSSWGIPTGKFLVLEGVSAQIKVNPGEKVVMSVACQGVAGFAEHHLVLTSQGVFDESGPNVEIFVTSAPVRCYSTGAGFFISFTRNSRADVAGGGLIASTEVSISGYLLDLPQ